jgi:trk system potassium uptake protein TrkA
LARRLRVKASGHHATTIAVIGLGRFGCALARELMVTGREVLGIDTDEKVVQDLATDLTRTVTADCTNIEVLRELGLSSFDRVVVAIGSDIESSILTASLLVEIGVKEVWAKATSEAHGRILRQIGVHHVVFPENDMGKRVAHQVGGDQLDYVEIDEGFVMAKTISAPSFNGKTLTELAIRRHYGVIVVATSPGDSDYTPANPETVLHDGDYLIVAGPKAALEAFSQVQ